MKILVMGLPNSGKTHFAKQLSANLECAWYNADAVRKMANDWDFSEKGRVRQSQRMRTLADFEKSHNRTVICDFVCPTEETRKAFDADLVVYMNTIKESIYPDTNAVFVPPKDPSIQIDSFICDDGIESISNKIKRFISVDNTAEL